MAGGRVLRRRARPGSRGSRRRTSPPRRAPPASPARTRRAHVASSSLHLHLLLACISASLGAARLGSARCTANWRGRARFSYSYIKLKPVSSRLVLSRHVTSRLISPPLHETENESDAKTEAEAEAEVPSLHALQTRARFDNSILFIKYIYSCIDF